MVNKYIKKYSSYVSSSYQNNEYYIYSNNISYFSENSDINEPILCNDCSKNVISSKNIILQEIKIKKPTHLMVYTIPYNNQCFQVTSKEYYIPHGKFLKINKLFERSYNSEFTFISGYLEN